MPDIRPPVYWQAYNKENSNDHIVIYPGIFLFQTFILLCCVAAGNDAASQEISDEEQIEFIQEWKKNTVVSRKI